MSGRYGANEPNTNGKVLLRTSFGELDVELWSNEAPLACRNFMQLCMEHYYDGVKFHRVIKDFMGQTGDPTGTGKGGESIYGKPFKNEVHSRIRFNHPGQLAMACEENNAESNQSQFFISLGQCEWLNKKNTIFGKVTGNTLYNIFKLNEVEVDGNDCPVDDESAPRILSTEVLHCPFDDIKPREVKKGKSEAELEAKRLKKEAKRKKKERKHLKKKDTRLMSFQDEENNNADDGFELPKPQSLEIAQRASKKKRPREEDKKEAEEGKKETEQEKERGKAEKKEKKSKKKAKKESPQDLAKLFEQRCAKYAPRAQAKKVDTLRLLESFNDKLKKVNNEATTASTSAHDGTKTAEDKTYRGGIGDNLMEDEGVQQGNDTSWMKTELKFKKHIDDTFRQTTDNLITVIDSKTSEGKRELNQLKKEKKPKNV